ncbi:MAG: hypothetical protein K9M56_08460 [Victivallales bacterium]|nr:hypothetical protein [Victivallales bacterium]
MKKLEIVRKGITDFYNLIAERDTSANITDDCINLFESDFNRLYDLNKYVDSSVCDFFYKDSVLLKMIKTIDEFRMAYGIVKEKELTEKILESNEPWLELKTYKYYSNYLKLVDAEIKGAGLEEGDKVLFIGSGPCPITLFILCSVYNIIAAGIEQNPENVEMSCSLIKHLGLQNRVNIIDGNHYSVPLERKLDLVMVGESVRPKKECFNYLSAVLPLKTKVSHRINEVGLKKLLDGPDIVLPGRFKTVEKIYPGKPVINTAVFYEVKVD